ncbi:MAG: AMP-binding protein [Bacteroidales bacterium]|nr:AMP-binding protein [Bacteroidales bacterium]
MFDYQQFKSNIAVQIPTGERWSYAALQECVNNLSQFLKCGSLLVVLCDNTIGSLIGYLSVFESKSTVLLLNRYLAKESINNILTIYKPEYIWLPEEQEVNGLELHQHLYSAHNYKLIQINSCQQPLPPELRVLLSTSGSTGAPKLVRISENNLKSNATSIAKYLKLTELERPITSLPMHYSFGLSVINSHLSVGANLLLTNYSYVQREFWSFASEEKATSFSGVPYTYEILKKIKFWNFNLPHLHTLTQAGGKLKVELIREYTEQAALHNKNFVVMYGQTEATARISYVPQEHALTKAGSIGIAIPDGRLEVVDSDGAVLPANKIGELLYYGDNVCWGYAESREDLLLPDVNHGRLETGDMAYMDEDGFFYIVGRKKRFLKIFGNRVGLDYTEAWLQNKYETEFICSGTDDLLCVYTTSADINIQECRQSLAAMLNLHPSAISVKIIKTVPRSDTGKILYHILDSL